MSNQSLRRVIFCWIGCCSCLYGGVTSIVKGQDDPQAVLKEKRLKAVSGVAVLADEVKVSKMLAEVPKYRRELTEASKVVAAAERTVLEKDVVIQQSLQQRRLLNVQLANARTVEQNNKLVATINELSDRIELLSNSEQIEKNAKDLRAKANQLREKYVDHVLEIRKLHDKLLQEYEELAAAYEVSTALEELGKATGKPVKLGPSRTLLSATPNLKKIEDTVLSEKIALRGGDDKVWYVSVVLNGRPAQEFVLDTGASILSLPAKVAEDLGLEVTSSSPTLRLQLADGRVIEAKQAIAKSVRVGKFTVENVECAVLPPTAVNAEPLLGQSFLRHFSYKIDGDAGALVMSKVEGETTSETKGRSTTTTTKKTK